MIDVNQITSTLRGLPDRALQQYAMMHKGDPYILSLAVSESNQRKQLRTASQGQNAGQQPKVADSAIAGMVQQQVPEDQGIAQIPTPNIQRMADGGIAGYEDDQEGMATGGMGGMFNFAQQSEPVVRMAGGGAVQKFAGKGESLVRTTDGGKTWTLDIPKTIRDPSVPYYREIPNPAAKLADMKFPSKAAALEAATTASTKYSDAPGTTYPSNLGMALPTVENMYTDKEGVKRIRSATMPVSKFNAAQKEFGATEQTPTFQGPGAPIVPRFQPGVSDAPAPPAAAPDVAAPPAPAPAPAATSTGGVADLMPNVTALNTSYKPVAAPTIADATTLGNKFFNTDKRVNEINRQVMQEQMDANTAKENSIAALEAFNKKQGPAFAGYEKSLQKEELQDATDKDKAGLQALFKGFLAIAAGESPNAATNIAKGSMAGLEEYSGAMKEFKKAAKERNKELQYIEQARRAEDRGNFDKAQSFEEKAATANQASARFGIAAINDITNAGAKASTDIYNTITTNRSRENIAASGEVAQNLRTKATIEAQLNTPDRLVFNQLVKDNNNNPVAAAEALQKMKAEKFNLYDSYSKYLTAFANKEGVSPPLPFDQYAKQFIPEVNPNKNTTIRTQPGG